MKKFYHIQIFTFPVKAVKPFVFLNVSDSSFLVT